MKPEFDPVNWLERPDTQKVAWLGQALVLLLQAELDRTPLDTFPRLVRKPGISE